MKRRLVGDCAKTWGSSLDYFGEEDVQSFDEGGVDKRSNMVVVLGPKVKCNRTSKDSRGTKMETMLRVGCQRVQN